MRCCTKVTNALTVMRLLPICDVIHFLCSTSFPHNLVCRMENELLVLPFLFFFRFKLKKSWCITIFFSTPQPSHQSSKFWWGTFGNQTFPLLCFMDDVQNAFRRLWEFKGSIKKSLLCLFHSESILWWAIIVGPYFPRYVGLETRKT